MSAPVRPALHSTAISVIYVVIYLISNALTKGTLDVGSLVVQLIIVAVVVFAITYAISAFFGNRVRTGGPR